MPLPLTRALTLALIIGSASCGPGGRTTNDAPAGLDSPPFTDAGPDGLPPDFSKVYAHSGSELYRIDTTTLAPDLVGPISGLGTQSLTDLAIDSDDHMVGVTLDKLYAIDPETGAASLVTQLEAGTPNLTSLSFVPIDLGQPTGPERLVAATDDGTVYELNPTDGTTTVLGSYGTAAGETIASSGDLMAVRGLGIYATVTIGLPFSNPDYLARIDPVTWQATPLGIGTEFDRIFGIGFWRGTLYGFVDLGDGAGGTIVELDPNTGAATVANQGSIRWYGAGVTTDAPIIE